MGDMADYTIEQFLDWFENDIHEEEPESYFPPIKIIYCKYCGKPDLKWNNSGTENNQKWKLIEQNGTEHFCDYGSW
jgi:hypothetical protein